MISNPGVCLSEVKSIFRPLKMVRNFVLKILIVSLFSTLRPRKNKFTRKKSLRCKNLCFVGKNFCKKKTKIKFEKEKTCSFFQFLFSIFWKTNVIVMSYSLSFCAFV